MKRYGDTKTNLTLTEKAFKAYSECDPCSIIEHDDGSFSIMGIDERHGMTEQEVNAYFEQLADEIF